MSRDESPPRDPGPTTPRAPAADHPHTEALAEALALDDDASLILPGGKVDPDAVRAAADDDAPCRVVFTLSRDLKKRLDRYLTDRIPFMSRSQLQRLIANEAVTVNGRTPKASTTLRQGDVVEVIVPPPPPSGVRPERIPLEIVYEDEELIVLNKQPDIIVHPARSHLAGTMINALAWHFQNASATGGSLSNVGDEFARPGVVHRLDRHTTGVIVFAKQDEAHWKLGRQFEHRQVDKRYLALVHGEMETLADVIDLPIGPHPSKEKGMREKYVVRHDEQGKNAVTIYRVRERYQGYTLVELELKTGRTHQIRVHLSHLGYPIVGDDMYGGRARTVADVVPDAAARARWGADDDVVMGRQALHAAVLGFRKPATGEPMTFTAPLPMDMARLVAILRAHRALDLSVGVAGATVDLDRCAPRTQPDSDGDTA
ncbi:MAG: RluA family pseudouridine synthase [Phycisphaerales bacterium]|nr:MAG: RluA family pseudouridine synthase [Phycisphaerales bacterium]